LLVEFFAAEKLQWSGQHVYVRAVCGQTNRPLSVHDSKAGASVFSTREGLADIIEAPLVGPPLHRTKPAFVLVHANYINRHKCRNNFVVVCTDETLVNRMHAYFERRHRSWWFRLSQQFCKK